MKDLIFIYVEFLEAAYKFWFYAGVIFIPPMAALSAVVVKVMK